MAVRTPKAQHVLMELGCVQPHNFACLFHQSRTADTCRLMQAAWWCDALL